MGNSMRKSLYTTGAWAGAALLGLAMSTRAVDVPTAGTPVTTRDIAVPTSSSSGIIHTGDITHLSKQDALLKRLA